MKTRLDGKGRYRNVTTAFRMSQAESDLLNSKVRLSGLTKQEYILRRCFEQDIVVKGSSRIYIVLKKEMKLMIEELRKVTSENPIESELLERIFLITKTMEGMNK